VEKKLLGDRAEREGGAGAWFQFFYIKKILRGSIAPSDSPYNPAPFLSDIFCYSAPLFIRHFRLFCTIFYPTFSVAPNLFDSIKYFRSFFSIFFLLAPNLFDPIKHVVDKLAEDPCAELCT
jgi:hypothetical protein